MISVSTWFSRYYGHGFNRKERKDTRAVKVLFSENVKIVVNAITEKKVSARKNVTPPRRCSDNWGTSAEKALKERSKPLKKTSKKTIEKSVAKENVKWKLKEPVKKGKGPLPGSHRGKGPVKSRNRQVQRNEDFQFDDCAYCTIVLYMDRVYYHGPNASVYKLFFNSYSDLYHKTRSLGDLLITDIPVS